MKNKIIMEIMDLENISFEDGDEPTNITNMIDLEVDPLPDVFLKLLAEEEEKENE